VKPLNIFITGTTSGIGRTTADLLLEQGHQLYAINRNESAAAEWKNRSRRAAQIKLYTADLSHPEQLHRACDEIMTDTPQLDVLLHNAGAVYTSFQTSASGAEMSWAVNHLGPFLLSHRLHTLLPEGGRIVLVSSEAHRMAPADLRNMRDPAAFNPTRNYASSKLGNLLFAFRLAEKLRNHNIRVNALHPGLIRTPIGLKNSTLFTSTIWRLITLLKGGSTQEGARWPLALATAEEGARFTGTYFSGTGPQTPSKAAQDKKLQTQLWNISCELLGINDHNW
jgi:NAD(P)-dependent dehydrogenase (short-subunit alcohol dehydrogenase family)